MHRYRSQARNYALARTTTESTNEGNLLSHSTSKTAANPQPAETGALDSRTGPVESSQPVATAGREDGHGSIHIITGGNVESSPPKSNGNTTQDTIPRDLPPAAPPPIKSEDASAGNSSLDRTGQNGNTKPPMMERMKAGSKRFGIHFKNAIFHSWINVLLVAVPVGIAAKAVGLNAAAVFAINAVAIVPLAGLLSHATESVASRLGDTLGALLNVSFGNAVELIIFIIALVKHEITIVQASLLGSILANLLLILGMAFLFGGLRFREQVYNNNVTQMSACLLSLSVMSLLLPTAFHASFSDTALKQANENVLKVSRGVSVVLLIVYVLYLLFQLKSHAHMYESTPQEIIDEESYPGVLAEIMNSSSSSEDSSSSDSSDTDSSGSQTTTKKRVKRMFKNRKHRKSSGGSASSTRPSSVVQSVLSSPSTTERKESYWENQVTHHPGIQRSSTRASNLGEEGADADEEGDGVGPRIRDFVVRHKDKEGSKSPERKKKHKKHHKKSKKQNGKIEADEPSQNAAVDAEKSQPLDNAVREEPFDDTQVGTDEQSTDQSSGKLAFNMRQISPRGAFRPTLPKMFSNNVFVQPPPTPTPAPLLPRPALPRAQTDGAELRRTNSLPDRLNDQYLTPAAGMRPVQTRASAPLPAYQQQRVQFGSAPIDSPPGIGEGEDDSQLTMSRTAAVVLLLASTSLVAICAEFMVDAIPAMIASSSVSQAFIGLIILPIVGNAAEHVTAVTVATKNKMDLAIGVAVGSSIQIALFVTPIIVLLGWILDTDMSLYFNLFETVSLFVTAFVVNFLVLDGRSNYLEGALLIAAYIIIALGAFFYPAQNAQSTFGGGASDG